MSLGGDLRFGVRTWLRQPTLALVALATLTLGIGATGAAATMVSSSQDDPACDPATLQYILHMATRGEELAKVLDGEGRAAHAKAIRNMTDVNSLPNDLQICALLSKQGNTTGTTP